MSVAGSMLSPMCMPRGSTWPGWSRPGPLSGTVESLVMNVSDDQIHTHTNFATNFPYFFWKHQISKIRGHDQICLRPKL